MFVDCLVEDRESLVIYLKAKGIGTRNFYPAIHHQKIYDGIDEDFPGACLYGEKGLWLPSSVKLTDAQIDYVCSQIANYYREQQGDN